MTPEETREHVQRRLSELGWNVHIGRAGYDKIFQATGGAENETNRICHRLISLGSAGESREITDATVDVAVTEGTHSETRARRPALEPEEVDRDRVAIERLAAILEVRLRSEGTGAVPHRVRAQPGPAAESPAPGTTRPTALVVLSASETRAQVAGALARDFRVLQASDGEQAWNILCQQQDIGVLVMERAFAEANGHSLPRRMQQEGDARLAAVPIVVLGEAREGAPPGERGPGMFVPSDADPGELRARVLASYKARHARGSEVRRARREPAVRRPPDVLFADTRYARNSGPERPARFASTLAITLGATALLALALLATYYISRNPDAIGLGTAERSGARAGAPEAAARQNAPATERAVNAEPNADAKVRAETVPPRTGPPAGAPAAERGRDTAAAGARESNRANPSRAPPGRAARDTRTGEAREESTADTASAPDAPLPRRARAPEALAPDLAPPSTSDPDAASARPNGAANDEARVPPARERLEQQAAAADAGADRVTGEPDARPADGGAELERGPSSASAKEPGSAPVAPDSGSRAPEATEKRARPGATNGARESEASEADGASEAAKLARADPAPSAAEWPPPPTDGATPKLEQEPAAPPGSARAPSERRASGRESSPPPAESARTPAPASPPTPARSQAPASAPTAEQAGEPAASPRTSARAPATAAAAPLARETPAPVQPPRSEAPASARSSPPVPREPPATPPDPPRAEQPGVSPPRAAEASKPPPARSGTQPTPALPRAEPRTDVARARPTPAPAPQPASQISRDELVSLVHRFASVYEAGDLEQFLSLFAPDARTNDRVGRDGIRKDYAALFGSTDLRQMKLGRLNWEVDGNQAYGWGEFDVTVRRQSDRQQFSYTGSLTFVVERIDGRLQIVRLFHGQQRVQS